MTNKTEMVSVPRELLEKIEKSWRVPDGCPKAIWDGVNIIIRTGLEELREILAAPAEDVRAVAEEAAGYRVRFYKEPDHWMVSWKALPADLNPHCEYQLLYACLDAVEALNKC